MKSLPDEVVESIRSALLAFFDASARALPWRGSRDAYRILVSEVMAQQTRIETVIPYFERWLQRFPDVHALAAAAEDDVLREWAGLGYYSRARNLHAAARIIRERHAGEVPSSYDALRALPGVGDYTAGAVSSIAFAVAAPAVDGNARRVLSRLLDLPDPAPAHLRAVAASLVSPDRPGDFNQALMELGSRVCTPRAPRCHLCPLAQHCAARAAGTQLERPATKPKKTIPVIDVVTPLLRDPKGHVLITRRPEQGLLAGMWSFPASEIDANGADVLASALATGRMALPSAELSNPRSFGLVEHTFSHRRERYHCVLIDVTAAPAAGDGQAWTGADARAFALPRAQQRIHAMLFAD